jgi:hypothetical protein
VQELTVTVNILYVILLQLYQVLYGNSVPCKRLVTVIRAINLPGVMYFIVPPNTGNLYSTFSPRVVVAFGERLGLKQGE